MLYPGFPVPEALTAWDGRPYDFLFLGRDPRARAVTSCSTAFARTAPGGPGVAALRHGRAAGERQPGVDLPAAGPPAEVGRLYDSAADVFVNPTRGGGLRLHQRRGTGAWPARDQQPAGRHPGGRGGRGDGPARSTGRPRGARWRPCADWPTAAQGLRAMGLAARQRFLRLFALPVFQAGLRRPLRRGPGRGGDTMSSPAGVGRGGQLQYLRPAAGWPAAHDRAPRGVPHEIVVVDNASHDGSPEMVAREFPEVRLIRNPENVGFGRANNQGMAAARAEVFILLKQRRVAVDPPSRRPGRTPRGRRARSGRPGAPPAGGRRPPAGQRLPLPHARAVGPRGAAPVQAPDPQAARAGAAGRLLGPRPGARRGLGRGRLHGGAGRGLPADGRVRPEHLPLRRGGGVVRADPAGRLAGGLLSTRPRSARRRTPPARAQGEELRIVRTLRASDELLRRRTGREAVAVGGLVRVVGAALRGTSVWPCAGFAVPTIPWRSPRPLEEAARPARCDTTWDEGERCAAAALDRLPLPAAGRHGRCPGPPALRAPGCRLLRLAALRADAGPGRLPAGRDPGLRGLGGAHAQPRAQPHRPGPRGLTCGLPGPRGCGGLADPFPRPGPALGLLARRPRGVAAVCLGPRPRAAAGAPLRRRLLHGLPHDRPPCREQAGS